MPHSNISSSNALLYPCDMPNVPLSPSQNHRALAIKTTHTALPAISRSKTALPYPDENESASLINNWSCNAGASVHMTPRFIDLEQEDGNSLVEKQPSVHVGVAAGNLVDVPWRSHLEPDLH
jgi:hypothetical protein